jgi:pimeloyl-ACP methyl ester carboxylesterase
MRALVWFLILGSIGCKSQPVDSQSVQTASTDGAPPVAVMIHGAGGGGWEWRFWQEEFERAGWKVIAPDLQPAPEGLAKTTAEDYVEQVRNHTPKNAKTVLIGASMGGILVLKAAETLRPAAVILVNSVPPKGVEWKPKDHPIPDVIPWANGPLQETRDALWDSDEDVILWAHERWRDESGAVVRALRAGIEVRKPTFPVLVIASDKDTDIPPEVSRRVAEWARADYVEYREMSHVGPLLGRRARQVAQHTLGWLGSVTQTAQRADAAPTD